MFRYLGRKIVPVLIGTIVFGLCSAYIFRSFQWQDIGIILRMASFRFFFFMGSLSIFCYFLLRAFRWWWMLRLMRVKLSFRDLYLVSSTLHGLSLVTPMQFGELLKIELLRRSSSFDRRIGYACFVVERIFDLLVVLAFFLLYMAFERFPPPISSIRLELPVLILLCFVGSLCCLLLLWWLQRQTWGRDLLAPFSFLFSSPSSCLFLLSITIFLWCLVGWGWAISLKSVSVALQFHDVMGLVSVMALLILFSMLPGGVGIIEAGVTTYLIGLHQSSVHSQAGALMIRAYGVLILFWSSLHYFVWRKVK